MLIAIGPSSIQSIIDISCIPPIDARGERSTARRTGHILAETQHVAVEIAYLEFLHPVNPQLRRRDDVGAGALKLGMERIDIVNPEIGVERLRLEGAV